MSVTHPESAQVVNERAQALVKYLLAARSLVEKPARTLPRKDLFWQSDFPAHSACQTDPGPDGSWLRVGRPGLPAEPALPHSLTGLLDAAEAGGPPALRENLGLELTEPELLTAKRNLDEWVRQRWTPWREARSAADATRSLHDRLFGLMHQLDMQSTGEELVWGHGIVTGAFDGKRVQYPLIVTTVAIEYDAQRTIVTVSPQSGSRLQTEALMEVSPQRVQGVMDLAGPNGQLDLDPWSDDERQDLIASVMRRLGLDPVIRAADDPEPALPHVWDSGVLFVRPKQRMIRRFLTEMGLSLDAGTGTGVGALSSILSEAPSSLRLPTDNPARWEQVGSRLLMPLPTNDEQESIARRLAGNRNVAVQGPPGTGKTHTIRNLLCHLMAHGKRVLVLSQKEDPLRVIRDGLPEAVQPLCLAVLGRSADQLVQLKMSVRELSDRAASLDQHRAGLQVADLVKRLEQAERDRAAALAALRAVADRESQTLTRDGVELDSADVGEWLRQQEQRHGFIPDTIRPGQQLPLSEAEFQRLRELLASITPHDRALAVGSLPALELLPSAEQLAEERERLLTANRIRARLESMGITQAALSKAEPQWLDAMSGWLRSAAAFLAGRENTWLDRLSSLIQSPVWHDSWVAHIAACEATHSRVLELTTFLSGSDVRIPDGFAERPHLSRSLTEIKEKLAQGKRLSRLWNGELTVVADSCQVNGHSLAAVRDVDCVVAALERDRLRSELQRRWQEWAQRLGLALPAGAEPEIWADRLARSAAESVEWDRRRWPEVQAQLVRLLPALPGAISPQQAEVLAAMLGDCSAVIDAERVSARHAALASVLRTATADPSANILWRRLHAAWESDETADWHPVRAEAARLHSLRALAVEAVQLLGRLAQIAPEWADAVASGATALPAGTAEIRLAWRWRQEQTWFDEVVGDDDTAALSRRVERHRDHIRLLTQQLVVESSWLAVSRSLDDRKRAALAEWTTALRKIGKGTGKQAGRWQAVAQRTMQQAVDAVPVWVMSIDRALEQFQGGQQLFDVVIVDEASQADLFSLPVLSLAERAIVVGDDQQIGPQLVGLSSDKINAYIRAHLGEMPSSEHFDGDSSLYDHAVRRSPQRIMLTEHFRCVPAIIRFSSQHYYDGKIQPLRADLPAGLGDPIVRVHTREGVRQDVDSFGQVNVAEADALVDRVEKIIADDRYRDKTIGVISLLSSSGQAGYLLDQLQRRVGAHEMERRRLRVGDPYTFQGDERDVVLISMVVSANDPSAPGAFTKLDYQRRVNVAASRARDQMWIFHSIESKDLNLDDARGKLLAYAQHAGEAEEQFGNLEARCDSDFERAVLRRLLERGYQPIPQFSIGSFRVDFVIVLPDGRRLAIECDGDRYHGIDQWEADVRRQAILERVGKCVFVRIRGSRFSRDPGSAMQPVWDRLAELTSSAPETRQPEPPSPSLPAVTIAVPDEPEASEQPPGEQPSGHASAADVQMALIAQLVALGVPFTINADGSVVAGALPTAAPVDPPTPAPTPPPQAPTPAVDAPAASPAAAQDDDDGQAMHWVPVPAGHRSVAWIRPAEAAAAVAAYRSCADVPVRDDNKVTGWARYHAPGSAEATKYRANVQLIRASNSGQRFVCWLRFNEAEALLAAGAKRRDTQVVDETGRATGQVQFFAPLSAEAKKYRSTTRLLRSQGQQM